MIAIHCKLWLLVPVALLSLLSAYLFVKFIGAAAYYSDWGPITDVTPAAEAVRIVSASHRADVFFLRSVLVTALAGLFITPIIQLNAIRPNGLRFVVRYLVAFSLCFITTGVLVLLLGLFKIG